MLGFSAHIPMMELLAFAITNKSMAFYYYMTILCKKFTYFYNLLRVTA
jgi:hypothetical protein